MVVKSIKIGPCSLIKMCQKRIDVHVMVLDPVSTPSKCPTRNRGSIFCIYTKISHISSYDLNRHVTSVHKQEKPCKCELYNHYFSRKSSLLNHVASIHEQKNHFKCEFCDKKFLKNVTWMYMLLWVISRKAFQMSTLWPNFS